MKTKIKIPQEQPMMLKARKFAKQLHNAYKSEERRGRDCGGLLLHWIKECYWGIIVKEHLPLFDKLYKMLEEGKHTKKNKFVYGDADVGVWIEYSKKEYRNVIISESYCSCADDNIHIFIRDKYEGVTYCTRFRVATVWQREKHYPKDYQRWNDDRDIKIPSLNTYRKRDYEFGYFDCRDEGHSLLYNDGSIRVENAHWGENKIEVALRVLKDDFNALIQLSHNKRGKE